MILSKAEYLEGLEESQMQVHVQTEGARVLWSQEVAVAIDAPSQDLSLDM